MGLFRQMLPTWFSPTNKARPAQLSCSHQRRMRLMSWREYPTQYHMALADAVSQSTVGRTIQPVENRLIQCRQFRRPSNRELLASQTNIQEVIVDVSEQPMERAKKQPRHYSSQKKTGTASPTNHQPTELTNHFRPKVGYRFQ